LQSLSELGQSRDAARVTLYQVVLELDERVVASEQLGQAQRCFLRFGVPLAFDEPRQLAVAAAAKNNETFGMRRKIAWIERRPSRSVIARALYPSSEARAASSSGSEAPSRNEKQVCRCSSAANASINRSRTEVLPGRKLLTPAHFRQVFASSQVCCSYHASAFRSW